MGVVNVGLHDFFPGAKTLHIIFTPVLLTAYSFLNATLAPIHPKAGCQQYNGYQR